MVVVRRNGLNRTYISSYFLTEKQIIAHFAVDCGLLLTCTVRDNILHLIYKCGMLICHSVTNQWIFL